MEFLAGNSLKKLGTYKIGLVAINVAWVFAVALAIYTVGDITGAHLNPEFTIAKVLNGSFQWRLVPKYIVAQILCSMFGSLLVYIKFLPHWEKTKDSETKLKFTLGICFGGVTGGALNPARDLGPRLCIIAISIITLY